VRLGLPLWEVVAEQLQIPLKPYTGLFPIDLLLLYRHRYCSDLRRAKHNLFNADGGKACYISNKKRVSACFGKEGLVQAVRG